MSSLPRGPRRDTSCTPYCNSFKLLEKEALAHEALKAQHASCLNEMQDAANLAEHAASKVEVLNNQIALLKRTLSATQDAVQSEQKMTAMLQQKLTASRQEVQKHRTAKDDHERQMKDELDECNESAERERELLLRQLEEKQAEVDRLRRQQPSPAEKLEAKEQEVLLNIMKVELQDKKEQLGKQTIELENTKQANEVMAAELEQSRKLAADAITDARRERAVSNHNENDVIELRTALDLSRQATTDVIEEMEREREMHQKAIGELEVVADVLRNQFEESQQLCNSAREERDVLSLEVSQLEVRVRDLEQRHAEVEARTAGLVPPPAPAPATCVVECQTEIVNQDPDSMDWYVELQKEREKVKALSVQVGQLMEGKAASEKAVAVLEERVLVDAFLVDEALRSAATNLTEEQHARLRAEAW